MIPWLLKKIVTRLPFITIQTDGTPYLTRWYVWPPAPAPGEAEPASRFAVFIHHFHKGDGSRAQHNHPWGHSASLVLAGGYHEERGTQVRVVRPGHINVIRSTDFHRVHLRNPARGCWTLFVAGRRSQDWGFRDDITGEYIPWRQYLGV
jgi:hypothetical protein